MDPQNACSEEGSTAMDFRIPIVVLGIGIFASFGIVDFPALGQTPSAGPSASSSASSDPDAHVPYPIGMGEVMAFGVQLRHLALAAGDWIYAAYALKELGRRLTARLAPFRATKAKERLTSSEALARSL
jgi:hypothetical protein